MFNVKFDQDKFENLIYEFSFLVSRGWRREAVYEINNIQARDIDILKETQYAWYKDGLENTVHYTGKYESYYENEMKCKYFSLGQALNQENFYD